MMAKKSILFMIALFTIFTITSCGVSVYEYVPEVTGSTGDRIQTKIILC